MLFQQHISILSFKLDVSTYSAEENSLVSAQHKQKIVWSFPVELCTFSVLFTYKVAWQRYPSPCVIICVKNIGVRVSVMMEIPLNVQMGHIKGRSSETWTTTGCYLPYAGKFQNLWCKSTSNWQQHPQHPTWATGWKLTNFGVYSFGTFPAHSSRLCKGPSATQQGCMVCQAFAPWKLLCRTVPLVILRGKIFILHLCLQNNSVKCITCV